MRATDCDKYVAFRADLNFASGRSTRPVLKPRSTSMALRQEDTDQLVLGLTDGLLYMRLVEPGCSVTTVLE
jgi:hypothetical protein